MKKLNIFNMHETHMYKVVYSATTFSQHTLVAQDTAVPPNYTYTQPGSKMNHNMWESLRMTKQAVHSDLLITG